jgi:hypothetical protein
LPNSIPQERLSIPILFTEKDPSPDGLPPSQDEEQSLPSGQTFGQTPSSNPEFKKCQIPKLARSDEPKGNKFQIKSKNAVTQGFSLD